MFFGFLQYNQELARSGCINKTSKGTSVSAGNDHAVYPRGMFITRANFYSFIEVLFAYGIDPVLKNSKLRKFGDNVIDVVKGMTTQWDQLSDSQQRLAQEGYIGLLGHIDRGLWKMLPKLLNNNTWTKMQKFPSLMHVLFGLTLAIKKKYKNKSLTKPLFCGGCVVSPDQKENNTLNNIWVTKSTKATKASLMKKERIPNWHALATISPNGTNANGPETHAFVSFPHAVALFCCPTRTDIDYKEFNKTKADMVEWEEGKTTMDKVIEYEPKALPKDDDDDDDNIDSKKKASLSINPKMAIRELQRLGEIATKMKTEPVPSDLVSPLENSILDLGKAMGLHRFESLTDLGAALTKQNGLGVHFTYTDILSVANHLSELSELNFQLIQAQADDIRKCLNFAGGPCVSIDDDWDDNGKEALLFEVEPKSFGVIHDAVIHGYKKKGKQVDWINRAISMIEAVSESELWICTIWNLRRSMHYEFEEVQTFVIISTDELKKLGLIHYKVYRPDKGSDSSSESD